MKTIGVLTSGGDAPGMNACVAAIAESAEQRGIQVRGIFLGFLGLLQNNCIPIGSEIAGLARRGGSFLGTSRNESVNLDQLGSEIGRIFDTCGLDGLIVLGGGGSLRALTKLATLGAPVVGIPCTIDNDVACTDYCLGFDSAANRVLRAIDEILDTAESLSDRVFLVETMGGNTGHLALATAYASSADAVFIPEQPIDIKGVSSRIRAKMDAGGTHGLIVLCEDQGTFEIQQKLEAAIGKKVRLTVLGHIQRGGNPTFLDRRFAREFGEAAVELIASAQHGQMIAYSGEKVHPIPLTEDLALAKPIDVAKYRAVNMLDRRQ